MIVFSAWAFGSGPVWAIWTMNIGGYLLGFLWLAKIVLRRATGFEPIHWGGAQPVAIRYSLGAVTLLLLLWCLVSATNTRAIVDLEILQLLENRRYIAWLPHSYDGPATWFAFFQYLGLAGVFWALRDWIGVASPEERRLSKPDLRTWNAHDSGLDLRIPHRLRRLIWVIALNGGAVALVGIVSTIDDPAKLLWLMPHEGRDGGFFGPFSYRNNGAQFVNLIWPLCLGLWLTYCLRAAQRGGLLAAFGRSPSAILPLCLGLMIAAPFISTSRGGSIIAVLMLAAALPVLILSMRVHPTVLLMSGLTILIGGGLGVWLARESLTQRFFRDFVSYPTGIEASLEQFTIRSTLRVPASWERQAATFAGISDHPRVLWNTPGSVTLSLRAGGVVEARFVERDRTRVLTLVATHPLLAEAGRTVEIIFTQHAGESVLYLNGESLDLRPSKSRAGFEWPEHLSSRFLWVGRGAGGSMKFNERIEVVTLLDWAMPEALIRTLADRDPQPGAMVDLNMRRDPWSELHPQPRVSVRPYTLSPRQWAAAGLGGRGTLYALSREMMGDYPTAFGSGPGTFSRLFMLFRRDTDPAMDWYAHNDYLETRITFGVAGAALVYLGLFLCPVAALCRGGLGVPWHLLVLMALGLAGALVHARFDWVFQTHALLFLGIVLCAIISASSMRSNTRRLLSHERGGGSPTGRGPARGCALFHGRNARSLVS
jgi:hypothetical protein